MRKAVFVALCLVVLGAFSGCHINKGVKGSGTRKAEKRSLPAFKAIETTGAYRAEIICQQPASFEIETDDNILPLIKTEVRDGVLHIGNEERINPSQGIQLRISLPELVSVSSRGVGDINIQNSNSDDLKIDSTGAGTIKATGKAKMATISSTGAGDIDTSRLLSEKARVTVTGAASVTVYATEQLDVSVSGAGSVDYLGNPKTVNKSVSGIGSVNKKGE